MIKTKEDLLNTRIRFKEGSALVEKYVSLAEYLGIRVTHSCMSIYEWAVNNKATWLCIDSKDKSVYYRLDKDIQDLDFSGNSPVNYRELTLEDFEPEEVQPAITSVTKYKYTLVDKSPEEIYRAMLDGEVFYEEEGEVELRFDGVQFISKDLKTSVRVYIKSIPEDNQICIREEVKWQDEVENLLDSNGVADILKLTPEKFLEAARIALKATGEIE